MMNKECRTQRATRWQLICLQVLCMLWCLTWASRPALAQQGAAPEAVKAAFLYHFGSFIDWPQPAKPSNAFEIAVLGDEAVFSALQHIAQEKQVKGRPLNVRRVDRLDDLGAPQIVFVGENHQKQLARLADRTRSKSMLLVSDAENGLRQGAAINFLLREQKVRFEVSIPAAERAGLGMSSRLLNVAFRVEKTGLYQRAIETRYAAICVRVACRRRGWAS